MADSTRRVSVRLSLDDAARVKAELREVGETGQRSLERIQDGADKASRALSLLDVATRGIQLAGVTVAARALVQAGDALTQSLFRLQTATGSVERAGAVYQALYRSALTTGVAVTESVNAFQRFSIAAREIGATSDQVVRLVAGLQRVAIVSGASSREIGSATLQLGQALASGVLQGDELRSLLEAMPLLAEGLAKELGVSIGELRQLGSEGKLTAERVFPALLRAAERIGAELDKAPLSLGRAMGQLTASTENFLGQLDRAIGLSNALARALSGAARAVDGIRQGSGLLSEQERLAGLRRQADALSAQILRLEGEQDGRDSLRAPPNRNSLRPGLVGAAQRQAGVDPTQRLQELRQQYAAVLADIDAAEQEGLNRRLQEQADAERRGADSRRRRAAQDILELTKDLDDRFRIEREYQERLRRLREAEAAGGVTAAERQRLEALATEDRDKALQRLEGTTRRVAAASREGRDAERELNELLRERERLGGNIIWAMPLIETATTKRSGGKGGGKRQTSTTYSYAANFAVAFCEGPVSGIRRIWADGKLFYDASEDPAQTLAADVRIYTGTESQAADALIAADVGAADCPAYRGLCYLVFEGLQLADFANRIPQITAEIEAGGADLARTLHSLASRAGVPTTDAASAARPLAGYAVARSISARAAIEELMLAYSLVGCAVPGGVAVKPRGVAALGGMEPDAFGARAEGDADADRWTMARAEENGLPRELTLTHMDPARDYQPGTVRSTRQDGSGLAKAAYDIAVVLDAAEAKARAEQAHRDLWAARNSVEHLTLPPAFATLQPGESLEVILAGQRRRLNITRATVAPSGLVEIAAAVEQGVTWLPRAANADPGSLPVQGIPRVVPSTLHLLDLPMLRAEDDDAGFYVAAGGPAGWRAAAILRAADGVGFEEIAYLHAPAVIGTCQTVLPSGPWAHFDEASTLDVLLLNAEDELDAISEAEVLAGGNTALVGEEIIGFRDALLIAPGTYRLSGLLRGRLGTDDRIAAHGPGERVVLLSGALGLERIRDGLGLRGISRSYKAVSLWQEEAAVAATSFANTARSLAPLSPVHLAGSRDDGGNLTITWIRRTRIPSAWADGTEVPLGEAAERYEIDIRNAANTATLRTIAATSPVAIYTAAEQAADFGAPQAAVRVRVQQISDTVGRGAAREAIV